MSQKLSVARFRIVRLADELQKEYGLPELICADPMGLPFPDGQAFYRWLIEEQACEPITAYKYLQVVLPFLTFLRSNSPVLRYTASAEQIRDQVREYLKAKYACALRPHRNGNFVVRSTKTITATSVHLFLVALKRFYAFAILKGWYTDPNPLMWTTRLTSREREFTPRMPPVSGMTVPDERPGRRPDTYFCVVTGDWQPRIIDDPNLPKQLLAAFTHRRDQIIARILFESGARISEVLGLTVGDWQACQQQPRAQATNKGSRGQRVKEIWWSSTTSQLLRHYLNQERREHDRQRRGWEDLPESVPLFITDEGGRYSYADFYFHWRKACDQAQLKVTPHQARHWFVTMALHTFESLAADQREAARQSLIAYLGWRNPETIQAYDHHLRELEFGSTHAALARLVEEGDRSDFKIAASQAVTPPAATVMPDELWEQLSQYLDCEEEPTCPTTHQA